MKKVTLLLLTSIVLLGIPLSMAAQKAGQWTVGAGFQPFFYQKYNKSDWNNRPNSYPAKPRKFNGLAGAIALGYSITDTWGIGAELAYSKQKQNYFMLAIGIIDLEDKETLYYNKGSEIKLDYLKLPLLATCKLELGYESGVYLRLMAGPQLSYNTHYSGVRTHYDWDQEKIAPDYDVIVYQTVVTPFHFHHEFQKPDGSYSSVVDKDTRYLYRRFELGVIAGAAIQKRVFQSYILSLGARYEQGLTDIENPKEDKFFVTVGGATGSYGVPNPRAATHNRRIVLDIGISRIID
jgi:hypothetical protein